MQRHSKDVHRMEEKSHKCTNCLKSFPSSQQLAQHSLVHTNIRKYKCKFCEKSFKQLCHVQQHQRTHTGERPYKCTADGCAKAFAQLSNLQQHLKNHQNRLAQSEKKPFCCPICDRRFTTEASMNNHTSKLHAAALPRPHDLTCQVCEKQLYSEDRFFRHIHKHHPEYWRVFSGGRALSDFLNTHEVRHRDKPYSCEVCHKRYSHETGLMKHMATHPDLNSTLRVQLLSCPVCQKVFTKESFLARHMEMKQDEGHAKAFQDYKDNSLEGMHLPALTIDLPPPDGMPHRQPTTQSPHRHRESVDSEGGHQGEPYNSTLWQEPRANNSLPDTPTRSEKSCESREGSPPHNSLTPPMTQPQRQSSYTRLDSTDSLYDKFRAAQLSPGPHHPNGHHSQMGSDQRTDTGDQLSDSRQPAYTEAPPHSITHSTSMTSAMTYQRSSHDLHGQGHQSAARMRSLSDSSLGPGSDSLLSAPLPAPLPAHSSATRVFDSQRISHHDLEQQLMGPPHQNRDLLSPGPHRDMMPPPNRDMMSPPHRNMMSPPPSRDDMMSQRDDILSSQSRGMMSPPPGREHGDLMSPSSSHRDLMSSPPPHRDMMSPQPDHRDMRSPDPHREMMPTHHTLQSHREKSPPYLGSSPKSFPYPDIRPDLLSSTLRLPPVSLPAALPLDPRITSPSPHAPRYYLGEGSRSEHEAASALEYMSRLYSFR